MTTEYCSGNNTTTSAFHATWDSKEYKDMKLRLLDENEYVVLKNG